MGQWYYDVTARGLADFNRCVLPVTTNFIVMSRLFWLLCFTIFFAVSSNAQFETVYIGINGLTCSQCSRTVEMKIRKLDFVADVQMNLEHTEGTVSLKKDKKADMEKIAQAIADAGFSARYLQADLRVANSIVIAGQCLSYQGDQYTFVKPPKEPLKGIIKLQFLGKKFQPKNEFKKVEASLLNKCGSGDGKVYFVTQSNL